MNQSTRDILLGIPFAVMAVAQFHMQNFIVGFLNAAAAVMFFLSAGFNDKD